jgi:pimeloyl-ACP methyl ester carboxylesterase
MAFSLGLELIEAPSSCPLKQIFGARPAFLWIAWIGPIDDSLMARAHHLAALRLTTKYKVTDDGDMKARCRRAGKPARMLWVTAKTVSMWQNARRPAKPHRPGTVALGVPRFIRTLQMISIVVVAALAIMALITQAGVLVLQRLYPAQGRMIEVTGAKLHVLDIGPREAAGPAVVMIHGASSNLEAMRGPLGDTLAGDYRVILIDRPGHGWSTRARLEDSTPAIQGRMIDEALEKLGVGSAIFVVHSWSGALGARMALDYPKRVAGLVMLAPVAYPWRGGVGWYNKAVAMPVIGPLLAYTITLPLGILLAGPGARGVFLPQTMPQNFVADSATPLLLRPREFLANARDLMTLKSAVDEQAPRYGEIKAPVVVISGDVDKTVTTSIHSRPFARAVSDAKLIVLPEVGHMIQYAAPELVIAEVDAMIGERAPRAAAAAK